MHEVHVSVLLEKEGGCHSGDLPGCSKPKGSVQGWEMLLKNTLCFSLRCRFLLAGSGASILQKAEIRLINQTVCNELLTDQLTPRMMCVGILSGGVDACQVGHSGLLIAVRRSFS